MSNSTLKTGSRVLFQKGTASGSLEEHPLSRLLISAAFDEATGKLRVSRGKIRKVIYLLQGHPIYVDSNLRNETLGAFLVSQNVIDEAQLSEAIRHARKSGARLGQALIDLGHTDSMTITAGLTAQTQMKVAAMLRWTDGSFSYTPGDDFSGRVPDSPVDSVRLVLGGLKRLMQADELEVDLQCAASLTEEGKHFVKIIESVFGAPLLERCTGQQPLSQSTDSSLPMAELCLQVNTLLTCGMAELGEPVKPGSSGAPHPPPAAEAAPQAGGDEPVIAAPSSEALPPLPPLAPPSAPIIPPAIPPAPEPEPSASQAAGPPPDAIYIPPALSSDEGEEPLVRSDTFEGLLAVGKATAPVAPDADQPSRVLVPPALESSRQSASLDLLPAGGAGIPSADELDLEPVTDIGKSGRPMVLGLEHLDPTCASSDLPALDLEFLQPQTTPPSNEDDSGVLSLPSLDDLELEDRDPEAMASKIAAGLQPLESNHPEADAPRETPRQSADSDEAPTIAKNAQVSAEDPLVAALKQTYNNIHEKNYYEMLGLPASADSGAIEQAYRDLSNRFAADNFAAASSEAQQCDDLQVRIKQASTVLLDPLSRHAYDERLAVATPQSFEPQQDNFGAELFFQDGQNRLRTGDPDGAVRAFSQAINESQSEPHYHAFLGWALFIQRGRGEAGAKAARQHFDRALKLAPDSPQTHELAALVEDNVRNYRAAAQHLDQALMHGPARMDLFDQLRDALRSLEDYAELERQYRLMVFRLRTTDPEQAVPLWVDLAYLHHEKLNQPREAAIALDVAAKLAPQDPRVQAARASIGASAQTSERSAEDHRRRALDNPEDDGPLHDLVSLHQDQSATDELLTVTGLLVARNCATVEEQKVYERLRPNKLTPASSLIAPLVDEIKTDDDDPLIERIIAQLSPALCQCYPISLEELGSSELELLADIGLPRTFADVLVYVCRQLEKPPPPLYLSSTISGIIPIPGEHRRLLISQRLLDSDDEPTIAFATARALNCITEGRRHAFVRRGGTLKNAFVAAFSFCRPNRKRPPDPDGELARFIRALEQVADRDSLAALFAQIRGRKVNLSDWIRGVRRTAARVGLLLGGDPCRALSLVDDNTTREDLIAYALGGDYSRLRKALGLAVSG